MKGKNVNPKDVIMGYLEARAKDDALFAEMYKKESKTMDGCWAYIVNVAKKRGNAVCLTDDEVYGLAVHYYCEDDLKAEPLPKNFKCVAPEPKQWLTDEEKERVRKEAEAELKEELKMKLRKQMVEFEAMDKAMAEAEAKRKKEMEAKKAERERKKREKMDAKAEAKRMQTAGMGCLFDF